MDQNQASKTSCSPFITMVCDFFEILLFSVLFVMLIFNFVARLSIVSGTSMNRTLDSGDRVITSGLFYEPEAGDIIVFHQLSEAYPMYNEPIIKRVIATEGQHVIINFKDSTITVDGQVLEERYSSLYPDKDYLIFAEHHMINGNFNAIVPKGHVFVLGDNRNGSMDSRSSVIGFVDERRILGEAIVSLMPFEVIVPLH